MKNSIIIFLGFSLSATAACAQEPVAPDAAMPIAAPLATSRLRMFGQNGALALLFRNSACVKGLWSDDAEKVSGGFGSAFSSFIGKVSNTTLGIAETDTTRNLSQKDGLLSKAYFREYVLPSKRPSSMRMGFQNVSSFYVVNGIRFDSVSPSCRGAISFTPAAGADYEAAFVWEGKTCRLSVNQVLMLEGKAALVPVPVVAAPDC